MPNVLVIGSGAREHALAAAISRSINGPVWCYPGNVGTQDYGHCPPLRAKITDVGALAHFASRRSVDLTVVGPEAPMAAGIAEEFRVHGLTILAPSAQDARLETSKIFAKHFMARHRIPTADFQVFFSPSKAHRYIQAMNRPLVIKADGLAAGKGVYVCPNLITQAQAIDDLMVKKVHGAAGDQIVIEEMLEGPEISAFYLVAGGNMKFIASAGDYKRAYDGNKGPNTGGMGAYSPHPLMDDSLVLDNLHERVWNQIVVRVMDGMRQEGLGYNGFLYIGLMLTADGPKVLEFNVRLGDPEAQVILPRWNTGVYDALLSAAEGKLPETIHLGAQRAVGVTLASEKYPGKEEIKARIRGPIYRNEPLNPNGRVYHAATAVSGVGEHYPVATGGRILTAVGIDTTYADARTIAYELVDSIHFDGMRYRRDIAEGLVG